MKKHKDNQVRYLSQAYQLEETASPAIIRATVAAISLSVICFTAWAGFTNVNEVARTAGEVVPSGYQRVVQHLEGGIVRKIAVAEGDTVKEGQILLELDGAGVAEDLQRSRLRQVTLAMQEERLRAYIDGRKPDFKSLAKDYPDLARDQSAFYASMEKTSREEQQIVGQQIAQKREIIASLRADMATEQKNLDISKGLFEKKQALHDKGYLSETRYLEAQKAMNDITGNIRQLQYRIATAEAEIGEFRNRLSSLNFGQRDQAIEKLDAVVAERQQNDEILQKMQAKSGRLAVRAPVSGAVKGLAVNTVGGVVRPGETLMEIVPLDGNLVVQAKIPPQYIGHIHPGQPVKVKISSYDFSRYGLVNGKLEQISATTFDGEQGERYYQGRIRLEKNFVGKDDKNPVMPGMTVMAEIVTGEKTILQYLLKPIHNSLKTAFSER